MTTEEWLQGSVGFELTDNNINFVFLNRGVTYGADATTMTEKQMDLSRADALTIYLSSSNKGSEKLQDGNSSRTSASESFTYRDDAQKLAIYLYEKWDEIAPGIAGNEINNKTYMW